MIKRSFPENIMIEVTNCCNYKCFFCGSNVSDRKRGIIQPDLAIRLIHEAYDLGCHRISFHGMGEPFLCKELPKYVKTAKELGYDYIYLDTNGSLATPELLNPVLDAGLDSIKFSIHAASSETYRKITNIDCFDKVCENAKHMARYIKDNHITCRTIAFFALSKVNEMEADRFKEMMSEYFGEVWIQPIDNGSGARPDNKKYAVDGTDVVPIKNLYCPDLNERIIINWEGKAIVCCTDWKGELIYGDANTNPLEVLWNNEAITRIRHQHESAETLPSICKTCMGITV